MGTPRASAVDQVDTKKEEKCRGLAEKLKIAWAYNPGTCLINTPTFKEMFFVRKPAGRLLSIRVNFVWGSLCRCIPKVPLREAAKHPLVWG